MYGTLKAAVVHYTRCLADELQSFNVRVNALSPGMVKTARFTSTRVVNQAKMEATDTLDRYAEADEIADALGFPCRARQPVCSWSGAARGWRHDAIRRLMRPGAHGQVEGKVAIVTGAMSGIGEATARLLAKEGAKVVATGRNLDVLERSCRKSAPKASKPRPCSTMSLRKPTGRP